MPVFGTILLIQFSCFCRHSFNLKKRIFVWHTHIISLSVGPIIGLIAMPYILFGSFLIFILVNFFFRFSICVFSRWSAFAIGPNILIMLAWVYHSNYSFESLPNLIIHLKYWQANIENSKFKWNSILTSIVKKSTCILSISTSWKIIRFTIKIITQPDNLSLGEESFMITIIIY